MSTPNQNSDGELTWKPSVGQYATFESDQAQSFGGIIGAINDQIVSRAGTPKSYPHNFAGIIAALQDLTLTVVDTPVDNGPNPGNGSEVGGIWTENAPPDDGLLWFDTRQGRLFVASEGKWIQANGADGLCNVTTNGTPGISSPVVGQFWWNAIARKLYLFDGQWRNAADEIVNVNDGASTPVWKLITSTDGTGDFTEFNLPATNISAEVVAYFTNNTNTCLPGTAVINTQSQYNSWILDSLEELASKAQNAYSIVSSFNQPASYDIYSPVLWFDRNTKDLKYPSFDAAINDYEWCPVSSYNVDTQLNTLTSSIAAETSARQSAVTALQTAIANADQSADITTLQNSIASVQASIPSIAGLQNASTFNTLHTGLASRVTALENAPGTDLSSYATSASVTSVQTALQSAIDNLNFVTPAMLTAVEDLIPDISNKVEQSDIDTSISNITTSYLPRAGGTLTGAFSLQNPDTGNATFDFSDQSWFAQNAIKLKAYSGTVGSDYATFGSTDNFWEYAWEFDSNEDFCYKHGTNGKVFSVNKDGAYAKNLIIADFNENTTQGVRPTNTVDVKAKLASHDTSISSMLTDITALQGTASGNTKKVYYSDAAPTLELEDGDLWFDSAHLRLNVRHLGQWVFPDRVEDTALKSALFNAVQASTDYASLKVLLAAALI